MTKYKIKISCEKTDREGIISTHTEEVERSLLNLAFDEAEGLLGDMRRYMEREEEEEMHILPDDDEDKDKDN